MAIEYIEVQDALGLTRKLACELGPDGAYYQVARLAVGADGGPAVLVSGSDPLPVTLGSDALELTADQIQLNTDDLEGEISALIAANHTDLAAILAKLSADPATQTTLAAILAKLTADPATQTTLAAVLAKLSADPSTGAKQDTAAGKLDTLHADLGTLAGKDFATQTTLAALLAANHTDLAAILAKLTADPATQTTLAAVLAKLTADPSTGTKQDTQATKLDTLHTDFGTNHTDLAAILAKEETIRALLAGTLLVDSELPAAASLVDTQSILTAPTVGAAQYAYSPSDSLLHRLRVASGDGLDGQYYIGSAQLVYVGSAWDRRRVSSTFKTRADASVTAGTPAALWTPTTGKKFRVIIGQLSLAVAGQIILKDGSTEIMRSPQLEAGKSWDFDLRDNGKLSSAANNVLNVDTTATGNIGGWVGGTEE